MAIKNAATRPKRGWRFSLYCYLLLGGILVGVIQFSLLKKVSYVSLDDFSSSLTMVDFGGSLPSVQNADGFFNGIPILYIGDKSPISTIACVGDNFREESWLYRSCQFTNLCFNMSARKVVYVPSPSEQELKKELDSRVEPHFVSASTILNSNMSLGALNPKLGKRNGYERLMWSPEIVADPPPGYYELPEDYVLIPYHSFAGFNPGHLVWDDFLPMFTLLQMFGLQEARLLLLRHYMVPRLWATCESKPKNILRCAKTIPKFLPMMGVDPTTYSTMDNFTLALSNNATLRRSDLVCAKRAVAGMGMISDHGLKLHGWGDRDYDFAHNVGRARTFLQFRNFVMHNLNVPTDLTFSTDPFSMTVSLLSSDLGPRKTKFESELKAMKSSFSPDELKIESVLLRELTLVDQAKLAATSAFFVTTCGGGAVTSTFLSPGASLLVYFDETGGIVNNKFTGKPARLDWDFFNNAGYYRTHWLPLRYMDRSRDHDLLIHLIRHEMQVMRSLRAT